jgi:hypothetical protein
LWQHSGASAQDRRQTEDAHRFIVVFIDSVVLLLQVFIVVIWQTTMTSLLDITAQNVVTVREVLVFFISVFFVTRFLSVVQGIGEYCNFTACTCMNEDDDAYKDILWYLEVIIYCMVVCVLIALVFIVTVPKYSATNPEKRLIFLEQMMYENTNAPSSTAVTVASCSKGIQKNTLMETIGKLECPRVYNLSNVGPVSMKVFAWTRFFELQNPIVEPGSQASAHVLLCSNGFEQHWGECKRHFLHPKQFSDAWDTKVLNSVKV